MARIRTIKPEFWSSPGHEDLEPWARLLFIALWNWADDYGRGTANPRELAGFAFPNDEHISSADIRRMLGEIRRAFDVVFYEVDGRPYYAIPSWEKHQKIDKRSQPRYPGPTDGTGYDPDPKRAVDQHKHNGSVVRIEPSADPAESSPSPRRDLDAGTGEQGNRGTEESAPSGALRARTHTRARPVATVQELAATAHKPRSHQIVAAWNERHGRDYPTKTLRDLAKHVDKLIADRGKPEVIDAALELWHGRADAGPGLLPHLYVDALKAAHGATNGARPTRGDKVTGWLTVDDEPDAPQPRSARADKVLGWLEVDDEPEQHTPPMRAITGGVA